MHDCRLQHFYWLLHTHLGMHMLSPRAATWRHRRACYCACPMNTCLNACHVPALPHGGVGLHAHIHAYLNTATSQGYYTEAQACLYAHLIAAHLTMRQSRLTCLHVGCVGFHHVASCEHPFCMPTICQYCYVVAQACPIYTPAMFQHYRVITQAFLFTCLSHTRATTYCPGFSYLRE